MSPISAAPGSTIHARLRGVLLLVAALLAALLPAAAVPAAASSEAAAAAVGELFFSEYVEGSSTNKALEVYNGTGAPVDLAAAGYNVQMFFNGATTAGLTINLTGTVADRDVHVLVNQTGTTSAALVALADQTNGAGWFNGDDAVVLRRGTTVLDVIGRIGEDPGTHWGNPPTRTVDTTLRRKATVLQGDPDGSDPFEPSIEWEGFPIDTFAGLGAHTVEDGDAAPRVVSTVPADGASGVARDAALSVTFSEPVTAAPGAFTLACTVTGPRAVTVSGGPVTFTVTPTGQLGGGETCTATVVGALISDVDDDDPPDTMPADHVFSFSTADTSVCGDPATRIHQVQGSGATTPIPGQVVTVEGVVVGDYQGTGQFSGFHVQEEDADADGDPATSEGIFVFSSTPVDEGDLVRVTGTASEFVSSGQSLTQLSSVSRVLVCASGAGGLVTPTTVTLPVPSVGHWERYEGMRVTVPGELTVTEVFTLARFGEVHLSVGGRLFIPTHLVDPGPAAIAQQDLNNRSRILLDDGNNQQNIDPTRYPAGGLSASNTLRVGDTAVGVTGVLEQRFGLYRIQPVSGPQVQFVHTNPRPAAPDPIEGKLRIGSFNVLNYFNGDGLGGGFPTPRGANTPFEFARQRTKIISALEGMDADVVGLNEIENDPTPNSAIEDLVAGLNDRMGAGTYDFIDTGVVGTDEIKVALIYKPGSVTPVGAHAILTSAVDPDFDDTRSRPVVAQTFRDNDLGSTFTVAVNHLKSKGSACAGDPDTGDGQGNCNGTRTRAAGALARWLAADPTGSGDPDVLIIGDLNSYAKEDPIRALEAAGYTNLLHAYGGDGAYSYVFDGQTGYLDHSLASASALPQVKGVTEWHTNADEPIALDYNVEFKSPNHVESLYAPDAFRSSDHDALIVGFTPSWDFTGFLPPIVNPPGVTTHIKSSAAVSMVFSLDGYKGMDILAEGYPRSRPCGDDGPGTPTKTPGQVILQYKHVQDTYTYRWKTEVAWRGTCREFIMRLVDGSEHTAVFQFQ